MSGRDFQRSAVYSAETVFGSMLSEATDRGATTVIAGTSLTLPKAARFASIPSMQDYVDRVLSRPSVIAQFGPVRPVRVRVRNGGPQTAHYEPHPQVIAVPDPAHSGVAAESVLLHELAHHFAVTGSAHGPEFTATLLWLLGDVMGPEAAFVLRVLYGDSGVQVGSPAQV